MRMMKHRLGILGVMFLFLCGGCGGPKKEVVRVTNFMTDPTLIQILSDRLKAIEKVDGTIEIRFESIPYNTYQDKLLTQAAAGSVPDVVFVEVNNFVALQSRGLFEDLTPYLHREGVDLGDYEPALVHRFTREGKLYALPQDIAPEGLVYYNKRLFREAGVKEPTGDWSWPEPFLTLCRKLTRQDGEGRVTHFAFSEAYPLQIGQFVFSAGADWVDDPAQPKRCTIDSAAFQKAARFRWDLIHTYHVSPSPTQIQNLSGVAGVEEMFASGRLAMMVSGVWHTPKFLLRKDLEFDVVPFPKGPGGKAGWSSGGSGYAICSASKHKETAWRLIRAILSEESVSTMAATGFLQPALRKLARSDVFLKAPGAAHKSVLLKMGADSHFWPFDPRWGEIQYGMIWPALDPVWNGDRRPEEVLPDLCRRVNAKYYDGRK